MDNEENDFLKKLKSKKENKNQNKKFTSESFLEKMRKEEEKLKKYNREKIEEAKKLKYEKEEDKE